MRDPSAAMTPAPVPAVPQAAPQAGLIVAAPETDGYMISTLELSAGLDVMPLALSTLCNDTLSELLRLRGHWAGASHAHG